MNLKMNIAVVDDGGHLLAFERMEGARPASSYTSLTKAITAATFRQATGPIPAGTANPDPILNLGLQNAALASGGKITTLYGGVPVTVDGRSSAAWASAAAPGSRMRRWRGPGSRSSSSNSSRIRRLVPRPGRRRPRTKKDRSIPPRRRDLPVPTESERGSEGAQVIGQVGSGRYLLQGTRSRSRD